VPAMPSWLLEPLWDQSAALLPDRPVYDPSHPLSCHKPPDRGPDHLRKADPGPAVRLVCVDRRLQLRCHHIRERRNKKTARHRTRRLLIEPPLFAGPGDAWPGVRRAGLPKAEPGADAGPAAERSGAALI
jgi:hypothetical protein